ncbi:MAG: phosphatase PAP2 family protein [Pedococcus sp.]
MGSKIPAGGMLGPLVRIVLVAFAFGVGFMLVYYVTVRTIQGRLFGDASLRGALLTRLALADGADTVLNVVSVASLLGAVALVATVALIRLERVRGLAAVGLLIGANVSTLVLKRYLLERPDLGIREVSPATLNSLPSGHATAVISAVTALLFVVPTRWRYPTALAGLVVGTVTALATMSAGWHRAADSMTAFLLVGVCAAIAGGVVLIADTPPAGDRASFEWPGSARWLAAVTAALLTLGLALGIALNAAGPIRDATFGTGVAFGVGGLLITGTGLAVLGGVLHVLDLMDGPRSSDDRRSRRSPDENSQG